MPTISEHTTFLITAEQLGLLEEYMSLARLLQPSIVVMEDVDLIARDRGDMRNPCEESLLHKLLNEMDGLREDAAVFFILTTNRPEQPTWDGWAMNDVRPVIPTIATLRIW